MEAKRLVVYLVGLELAVMLGLAQSMFFMTPVAERDLPVMTPEATTPWQVPLAQVTAAAARDDSGGADRAWPGAYRAALGSRRWEGMAAVGDVAARLGNVPGARRAYLTALF